MMVNRLLESCKTLFFEMCHFCRRERADHQCETCKRWVCIECGDCHNCYPRD